MVDLLGQSDLTGSESTPVTRHGLRVKARILFVSHAATRNGATILLLNLLRWLRAHTDYELEILVEGDGELVGEFEAIGRTTVWRNPVRFLDAFHLHAWKQRAESLCLKLRLLGRSYDLVYLNTSATASLAPALARLAPRLLWHIHELDYALRLTIGEERIRDLFPLATRFVAVSNSVRNVLVSNFKVSAEKVDLVYGSVPVPSSTTDEALARRLDIRRKLGWPDDAFVVGGCGGLGWRKGTDLFLQIARSMMKCSGEEPPRFLWVGGSSADEILRFKHDVRSLGLEPLCQLVPATAAVMDYYHAMDVFALTSREDPFPLVMLEAGGCRLPTVCFEGSGGATEFVGDDAGLVAGYLDVGAFVKHLELLRSAPILRQRFGAAAAQKVYRDHLFDGQGPKLLASIQHCLST